jgi:hypothetical protein
MIRLLPVTLFCGLVLFSANAQIFRGTVIVFGVSRDRVIVAGDSRGLKEGEEPDDHECKIAALGTQLLFTQAGTAGEVHTIATSKNWTASREALRSFSKFETAKAQDDAVDRVSADWLTSMKAIYSRLLRTHRRELLAQDGDVLLTSVFVGLDRNGQIEARQIGISFDRPSEQLAVPKLAIDNQRWEITSQNIFKTTGHSETALEFWTQSSPRALAEAQRWQIDMNTHIGENPDVLNAEHLVDVSERYAPKVWGIGGPIDVVEMIPHKGVHWIHRKPECPEHGAN